MKNRLLLILLLIPFCFAKGQSNIDSCELAIKKSNIDTVKINLLIKLSNIYLDSNPQKALETALKTEEIFKKRQNDKYTANALLQISTCQFHFFKNEEALVNIEKAIKIYTSIKDELGLSKAYTVKGNILDNQAEYIKAIELFNQSLLLAKKINYKKGLSITYSCLGWTYYKVDNLNKALENFNNSLKIDSASNDKSGLAGTYNSLGVVYDQKGDYQKSLEYYNKAYPIMEKLGNKSGLARLLVNIGGIYVAMKDFDKALETYRQSIKIKRQLMDSIGIANNYNNIAITHMNLNRTDSTLIYMKMALQIYTSLKDKRNIAMENGNLGAIYRRIGNETEALKYLQKAIDQRLELGDIKGAGRNCLSMGYLYEGKNNNQLALNYFEKALDCGEKSQDERLKMEAYMKISNIYEKQNNSKLALQYFQKYHNSSDTIYNRQKQKQILELQVKFETSEKDNQIILLNNQNEINSLNLEKSQYQIKRQRMIIGIVLFIVLLLAGFSTIYYRLFKQKQIANQFLKEKQIEIEQQNDEISSQRDSLEDLNHELEIQKQKVTNQRDIIEAELKKTLLSSEILQRENIQFKFEALKNQLNPHFLFNTFSTLINLIPANPVLAEQYTRDLSSVYRYILTGKDKELVKLNEEIDFVNAYMFLISIRFDDNVKLVIDIEKEKLDYYLPLLSLQLLIENAVKHNIISNKKPLLITIKNSNLILIIENNLQKKSSIENSTKIGLQNIINRYKLICDETVDIQQSETHFTVKLPLLKENNYLL